MSSIIGGGTTTTSSAKNLGVLKPATPLEITTKYCTGYYDATNAPTIATVPGTSFVWFDTSPSGNHQSNLAAGATIPTFSATGLQGLYPAVVFGAGQFMSVTDNVTMNYTTTGMCLMAVMQLNTAPTTFKNLISKSVVGTNNVEFLIQVNSARAVTVNISPDGTGGSTVTLSPAFTATIGVPFIVEIDFNVQDTVVWINGQLSAYSNTVIFNGVAPFVFGDNAHDGAHSMSQCSWHIQTLTASERGRMRLGYSSKFGTPTLMPPIIPTIVELGQSNETGKGQNASAPLAIQGTITNGFIFNTGAGVTQALQLGVNNMAVSAAEFGPEMETARALGLEYNRRIMIIKHSQSGAHLANDDLVNSYFATSGTLWNAAIANLLAAFAYERSQGRDCEIQMISWFQGEADMIGITAGLVPYLLSYQANLAAFIDALRLIVGVRGYGDTTVKFSAILSAIAISPYTDIYAPTGLGRNVMVNNSTISACASKTNATTYTITDIATFLGDNIHLDYKAQVLLGARRANVAVA